MDIHNVMAAAQRTDRPAAQRIMLTALAALAVCLAWALLAVLWVYWWMLLVIVLAVRLFL